jgi:hypothetical protein
VTLADVGEGGPGDEWVGDTAELQYANVMKIAGGPFDVTLVFGQQDHTAGRQPGQTPASEVARIAMSWAHLKSMIPLLARVVADYETEVGEIPSPGFDQFWKE